MSKCTVEDCSNKAVAKELCSGHYAKLWRAINPEYTKARNALYRKTHLDYFRNYGRSYFQANKEYFREADRKRYAKDPAKFKSKALARQALRFSPEGSFSEKDIITLVIKQRHSCNRCNCFLDKYDIDHIIPLSRGGSNKPENLQLLCPTCNRRKSSKLPHLLELLKSDL